jgi:hypothetical protein
MLQDEAWQKANIKKGQAKVPRAGKDKGTVDGVQGNMRKVQGDSEYKERWAL